MSSVMSDREKKVRGMKVYGRDFRPQELWSGSSGCRYVYLLRATRANQKYLGLDRQQLDRVFADLGLQVPDVIEAAQLAERLVAAPYKQKPNPAGRPEAIAHPARGLDLASLVNGTRLEKLISVESFGLYWLTPPGGYADHIGQPVALLLFSRAGDLRDFASWNRMARRREDYTLLRFDSSSQIDREQDIRRLLNPLMAARPLKEESYYGSVHIIRSQLDTCPDHPFPRKDIGRSRYDPEGLAANADPPLDAKQLALNLEARKAREAIRRSATEEGLTWLRRTYFTQSIDPMFMEPENGLAWFDETGARPVLRIAAGTQSPRKDREAIDQLTEVAVKGGKLPRHTIELMTFPIGGGFGGRDLSTFPVYLAMAALFSDTPVRLLFDRYEQFLCGIKRHAAVLQNELAYNAETGDLHSLHSTIYMDGGGVLNLTKPVVELCALHAAGPYAFKHNAISGYAISTDSAPAGSMRGFGIPQAAFAIESMIDEIGTTVGTKDPIEFRLKKNRLLKTGDVDVAGFQLRHHLDTERICTEAAKEPLWLEREAKRKEYEERGGGLVKYGVGFACAMQAIGTSGDAVFAEVSIDPKGEVTVRSTAIEMGQGSDTSLAIATTKVLGRSASRVVLGVLDRFDHPNVRLQKNNYTQGQPTYTPKLDNSMSASVTAFFHIHAVEQAAQVVFDHGLKPCARLIWGDVPETATWKDGHLVAPDRQPIPLEQLAAMAHEQAAQQDKQVCTGAIVHTYYRNAYACSPYTINQTTHERYIDGLSVLYRGNGEDVGNYERVRRERDIPLDLVAADAERHIRSVYASVGHLIAVMVHTRSGAIEVVDAVTLLDAGEVHHLESVEGQADGGFAMGLGMALLEEVPPSPVGVDGDLNLHRYPLIRATQLPPGGLQLRILELAPGEQILKSGPPIRKKGIAEAVMTPVMPAIANAIAHATGARLTVLPFTPKRVLEALRP
ncbi:molybdopterin-dependent oxidoreductase [Corallococcus exiguus]|uniref:xanthine dehydrogenase family protein molybdopterin-binding subunit n=1 Tax=Corallococcus exiguus TaxID=83462 RepID=UPI001A8C1F57|nr:molybdopterin cofactor-binding domain-containing protein [Corallococcus exiguus]MBN8466254.1 molybdopterin-dependent oxidoreductase [Corallococcus exiguus]